MTPQQEKTLHHRGLVSSVFLWTNSYINQSPAPAALRQGQISEYVRQAKCQKRVTEQVQIWGMENTNRTKNTSKTPI